MRRRASSSTTTRSSSRASAPTAAGRDQVSVQQARVDRRHEARDDAAAGREARRLDVLVRRVVVAADRAEAVERRDAVAGRPRAVRDAARDGLAEARGRASRRARSRSPRGRATARRALERRRAAEILVAERDPVVRARSRRICSVAQSRSCCVAARTSAERKPRLGTVFSPSPASSSVICSVRPSRAACSSASRSASRASASAALRPACGASPACAGAALGVDAEPRGALARRHDLAARPAALEAEHGVEVASRSSVAGGPRPRLLVRDRDDLDARERPRPGREEPARRARRPRCRPSCRRPRARSSGRRRGETDAPRRCRAGRRCRDGRGARPARGRCPLSAAWT